jgi:hypothetical protein
MAAGLKRQRAMVRTPKAATTPDLQSGMTEVEEEGIVVAIFCTVAESDL